MYWRGSKYLAKGELISTSGIITWVKGARAVITGGIYIYYFSRRNSFTELLANGNYMVMTDCRCILQNLGKHLAGMGKMPWLITLACYSLSLEIQTPRGIAVRLVLLTAIPEKPSRHSSDLNISYCWGEGRAWPVLQICVEGEPMARQELWEKQWGNKNHSASPLKVQRGICKEMEKDNQRYKMRIK